jgi:hypothetical protein
MLKITFAIGCLCGGFICLGVGWFAEREARRQYDDKQQIF